MCYHIFLAAGPEELARHFGPEGDLIRNLRRPSVPAAFSHLPYPVLTGDEQIQYSRWGLIPYWLRRPEDVVTVRNQTVNARAETIFENAVVPGSDPSETVSGSRERILRMAP